MYERVSEQFHTVKSPDVASGDGRLMWCVTSGTW